MYKPLSVFLKLSAVFLVIGLIPFVRYLAIVLGGESGNHLQSLIIGTVFLVGSFLLLVVGIVADLIHINRILLEDSLERIKQQQFENSSKQSR